MKNMIDKIVINSEIKLLIPPHSKDLLWLIENGYFYTRHTKEDKIGQASFYVIDWESAKFSLVDIYIYEC